MNKETGSYLRKDLLKALKDQGLEESPPPDDDIKVIPTGFYGFDNEVLYIGGVPRGRYTEMYGPPGGGKSNLGLRLIAQAQRKYPDELCAYIDTEARFTKQWAIAQGVNVDTLQFFRTNSVEEIGKIMGQLVNTGVFSLIVLDSLGNTLTLKTANMKEYYSGKGDKIEVKEMPGNLAKAVTRIVQQLTIPVATHDVAVLIINQLRDKIGVLYGSPESTPGGHAFGHDLTIKARVRKVADITTDGKSTGDVIGMKIGVNVMKNTLGPSNTTDDSTHLDYYFENGLEKTQMYGTYDAAARKGIIVQSGSWTKWYDPDGVLVKQWQGRDTAKVEFLGDPAMQELLKEHIEAVKNNGTFGSEPLHIPDETYAESEVYDVLEGA